MADDVKVFLAALGSAPALSLFLLAMIMLTSDEVVDIVHAAQIWLFIAAILAVFVLAGGGLYFVWTWAL